MEKKEILTSVSEQLMDLGIVLENLAKEFHNSELRTDPTMPVQCSNMDESEDEKCDLGPLRRPQLNQLTENESETLEIVGWDEDAENIWGPGQLVDSMGLLREWSIIPIWSLDADEAAQLMGIAPHTVRNLAECYGLPHFMSSGGRRGPGGRCRRYSWSVCVKFMSYCYSQEMIPLSGVQLLTTQEAAKFLEVSPHVIGDRASKGNIDCVIYGKRRYFFPCDVVRCKNGATDAS